MYINIVKCYNYYYTRKIAEQPQQTIVCFQAHTRCFFPLRHFDKDILKPFEINKFLQRETLLSVCYLPNDPSATSLWQQHRRFSSSWKTLLEYL